MPELDLSRLHYDIKYSSTNAMVYVMVLSNFVFSGRMVFFGISWLLDVEK